MPKENEILQLNEVEMRVVKQAGEFKDVAVDPAKTTYSLGELAELGVVRENYSLDEIESKGLLKEGVVTSFDSVSLAAQSELLVGAPFATNIKKYQLPINSPDIRILITKFPRNTMVEPHVHPIFEGYPGGGFRLIISGSVTYQGKKFLPGDWFYIPNGTPYSFVTDSREDTTEGYVYSYDGPPRISRLSAPRSTKER